MPLQNETQKMGEKSQLEMCPSITEKKFEHGFTVPNSIMCFWYMEDYNLFNFTCRIQFLQPVLELVYHICLVDVLQKFIKCIYCGHFATSHWKSYQSPGTVSSPQLYLIHL